MNSLRDITRRYFLGKASGISLGATALATLLTEEARAQDRGNSRLDFVSKAKHVIFLAMAGAPSQLDLFDYKPKLQEWHGKPIPESLIKGERFAFIRGVPNVQKSLWPFKKNGQSGATISSLMPH